MGAVPPAETITYRSSEILRLLYRLGTKPATVKSTIVKSESVENFRFLLCAAVSHPGTVLSISSPPAQFLFSVTVEFPTTSSSSFEFEFELARSFLISCGSKPSSYLINILICIFA